MMLKQILAIGIAISSTFAIATAAQAQAQINIGYGQTLENAERGEGLESHDFKIQRSGRNDTVGNGIDESVSWTFDFTKDQELLNAFLADDSILTSAELIFLDIKVTDVRVTTDWVGIPGYGGMRFGLGSEVTPTDAALIKVPEVPGIPAVGEAGRFSISLLDHGFSAESIMATFLDDTDHTNPWYDSNSWIGQMSDHTITNDKYAIPFIYMDDAIIREAKLVLTKENSSLSATAKAVPEPTVLAGLAAIGLLGRRRRTLA
ncbi:PEP-CTERM sorting domain-containing protein [Leptolyngbya cf. ectocarpi LEGE 11479]|uniref:PEP-CTERM sorting domain-containing protein n=1 Tax=Leptolyngbya cf. ectocarpi LEGE 11479 TaxID=1828722 RepID=A0A928ZTW6_LEPEC|nr:PEP-CTERM sorting domain-containing protein [Leptolyngbya ectocarpi]MBE9067365.1 PEP-CTERM sorting domain-containing protein [Leptolyngbya cf. ectocarpi LEGE 11479]